MRRSRATKIIATLGPASSDAETIAALFDAGADVFRLNFSHGSHADHRSRLDIVRELEKDRNRPIAIMVDLQGPKLRLGEFVGGSAALAAGAKFRLDLEDQPGDTIRAPLPHKEVFDALSAGTDLLLDDGRMRLRVIDCGERYADTEVLTSGVLSDHKGVNVPGALLPLSPLTEKDHRDLQFGLDIGADWVALSFVQRPEDIAEARKLVRDRAGILAKLEKPAAIHQLDGIIELADAVMVARGDLGVELPPEDVPSVQKRIVHACRQAGKPVVVATQMLESMVHAPAPTRAEASDVATAVYEGVDAVMLSAESAAGDYPVESVSMMDRVVTRVEEDPNYRKLVAADRADPEATAADAITAAARQVAETLSVAAIVTYSKSGSTAIRAARERPHVPIMNLTPRLKTARRLAIAWGVHNVHTHDVGDVPEMVANATDTARIEQFAGVGDKLVITAGMPFGTPGATNLLRIAWVGD